MNNTLSLKAYKRGTSLDSTEWYMASLTTHLAEKKDTDGAFCLFEANLAKGNEPPPHMHSREDELFYVLEGEFDVYVGEAGFKVAKGECVFLPRLVPHAFAIRSPQIRLLTWFTPAGLQDAFRSASWPAKNLELPKADLTYAKSDPKQIAQPFTNYRVRFLTPEEIADEWLLYPKPLPSNP
jgi:mannose-6-phosphate isomerase-like protein (cupin superfamily)